jgi:putative endonuclease
MEKTFCVYVLTNYNRTVFYVGITNDLKRRLVEHFEKRGCRDSFTGRYHIHYLVYFEVFRYVDKAIKREKEIKGWRREKKLRLIRSKKPGNEVYE